MVVPPGPCYTQDMAHRFLPRFVGGVVVALLVAATTIYADDILDRLHNNIDRFELWNACQPILLIVEPIHDDAVQIGLTYEAISTMVRSRLRAARLYRDLNVPFSDDGRLIPYLYVNVGAIGDARAIGIHVRFAFKKHVSDPISGKDGIATTWRKVREGITTSPDADFILSAVSRLTDEFIDEYLRVNESACPRSPIDP